MYELDSEDSNFRQRSKSVFDSLASLESTHRRAEQSYQVDNLTEESERNAALNPPAPTESCSSRLIEEIKSGVNRTNEPVFKVPVSVAPRGGTKRPYSSLPDYVKNPDKWKRYSLKDVEENPGANTRAAMSFLNSLMSQSSPNSDNQSFIQLADKLDFNRPIGKKKFFAESSEDLNEVNDAQARDNQTLDDQDVHHKASSSFVKRKRIKFTRTLAEDDECDEQEKQSGSHNQVDQAHQETVNNDSESSSDDNLDTDERY